MEELGIESSTGNGITHLGALLGDNTFMTQAVGERVEKAAEVMDKLSSLKDPHSEFVLLRSCFTLPKISYAMRTMPPVPGVLQHWKDFDNCVRLTLSRIVGSSLTDALWA